MKSSPSLIFVLNTHMPYAKNKAYPYTTEYCWFLDCMTDTYIPLFSLFEDLGDKEIDFAITISLTPSVLEMMSDPDLCKLYENYIESKIQFLKESYKYNVPGIQAIVGYHLQRFEKCREQLISRWNGNLIGILRKLNITGKIEFITSAISHAYLPLWESKPSSVKWQVSSSIEYFQSIFKKKPSGFWLPECGYFNGLEEILSSMELRYFFTAYDGIIKGTPAPKYDVNLPVLCSNNVAVFGKDWLPHNKIWDEFCGYPGDRDYLNFHSDIKNIIKTNKNFPFSNIPSVHLSAIQYLAKNGAIYNPDVAYNKILAHAKDFAKACSDRFTEISKNIPEEPVIVALFDTEHFGHFWHEGILWLKEFITEVNRSQPCFKLSTPSSYLRREPTLQHVQPSPSSWGYQGYNETWLVDDNHFVYPIIHRFIEEIEKHVLKNDCSLKFKQALLKELWLVQSSDWAFMIQKNSFAEYAKMRIAKHCGNIITLLKIANWQNNHLEPILQSAEYSGFLENFNFDVTTEMIYGKHPPRINDKLIIPIYEVLKEPNLSNFQIGKTANQVEIKALKKKNEKNVPPKRRQKQ
jgi:1,4-alpha-glucan branching enzyme